MIREKLIPVGRTRELRRLEQLLDDGGALVLEGAAGIGKTTIWRRGVELALERGVRVLAASPAEAEQSFSYALLGDLFEPVIAEALAQLPAPQARALRRALLLDEDDEPASPRALAAGVRSALRALAADRPLVVAVDDVQWSDAASAAALDFALRRLGDSPVSVLAAARSGHPLPLRVPLERLEVGPLSLGALHRLIAERLGAPLPRPRLVRLHEVSAGNPFYALELARRADARDDAVFTPSLQESVVARVDTLSPETRRSLAAAALGGASPEGEELSEAVAAGVLEERDGTVRFSHPLLAEAAVSLLNRDERMRLHRTLAASAPDAEQRALHLANGATGCDADVASAIALGAAAAEHRGALAAAGELWEHAAALTPASNNERDERLAQAAFATILAGDLERGGRLLDSCLDRLAQGPLRARGLMHRALIAATHDVDATREILTDALAEIGEPHARLRVASALVGFTGLRDARAAAEIADGFLVEVEAEADEDVIAGALTLAAIARIATDRAAWPLVGRALSHRQTAIPDTWISPRRARALALRRDGRFFEARELMRLVLQEFEQAGEDLWLGVAMLDLALMELTLGDLAVALELAERALDHSEQIVTPHMISGSLMVRGYVLGVAGHAERARADLERAVAVARRAHAGDYGSLLGLAFLELSLDRVDEAAAIYRSLPAECWGALQLRTGGRQHADAVGALATVGDLDSARAIAATLPDDARERSIAAAHLHAAEGDLDAAAALVRSARPSAAPLEQARELLLLGRLLRQLRRRGEAREALTRAREGFDRLGAPLWSDRCRDELARLGGRRPGAAVLTPSEQRVAELAAAGLANKEIAARLVVSTRTVESHLTKVYGKLGVRSRAALAARIARP